MEINWFQHMTRKTGPLRSLQEMLKAAGLGSMPGGGAEIFHPEIRDRICEHKSDADQLAGHSPQRASSWG